MNPSLHLSDQDRAALDAFVRRVREALGPNLVALKLSGSKATGRAAPDADLDVLVLVHKDDLSTEDHVLDIVSDVNLAHEVCISPRLIAQAALDDPVSRQTAFVQAVLHDAVPI